jgi:glycosyltransferase involved in cell wall biosynthesis
VKIALIVPGAGGVRRDGHARSIPVIQALIERLARRHHVLVVALDEPQQTRYPLLGATVVTLGDAAGPGLAGRWLNGLRRLISVLRSEGPFDIVHAFWAGRHAAWAVAAGRLLGARVVVSIGGGELAWLPEIAYGGAAKWRSRARSRFALKLAGAVTAGSRYSLEPLARIRGDAVWQPLGIDCQYFAHPAERSAGPPWRLLQVASINPVKDQPTLLRALRALVDRQIGVTLDCIGEDTLNGRLQTMADELGLAQHVRFHGFIPPEAIREFYGRAHVFVQSSRFESMGAAVLEAAAAGLPTVGTAVGLVAELAPKAALAVPIADPGALADGIAALLSNRERRDAMARAAQEFAHTYDADWTAQQFQSLYSRLPRP